MSDHQTALVPIESWSYQSPELRAAGAQIDVGLLAESLIYYDKILLNLANPPQMAELLRWAMEQNAYSDLLALIGEGSIVVYEYSFASAAVLREDRYILLNLQDPSQAMPNSFEQRFLHHQDVKVVVPNSSDHQRLCTAFRDRAIEVKADQYGAAIENARSEHLDPNRAELIMQIFVDEVYEYRRLGKAPRIEVRTTHNPDKSVSLSYNIDFNQMASLAGTLLSFGIATPLQASVISNRLTWSAATEQCDLYLPSPISTLVGDKIYEADFKTRRTQRVISQLKAEVEFPDVRGLVNGKKIPFKEVLKIRKKATRFRLWLQDESDRDRNAIIAYHHEVAKETGVVGLGRKTLSLLRIVGGGAVGGALGTAVSDPVIAAVAGAACSTAGFLADLGSRIGAGWKPVVFGKWIKERIEGLLGPQ